MRSERVKAVAIFFLAIGFSSMVAADWNLTAVDEHFSLNKTGVNTSTVQFVSIEYEDAETSNLKPVTPSNLEPGDEENITYSYNDTSNESQLQHYYGSYWYVDFEPNMTRGDTIYYEAYGTVTDGDVASNGIKNVTEDLQVGDYNMSVLTDVPDEVKPGKQFSLEVQVSNSSNNKYLNDSQIDAWAYFANDSWSSTQYDLGNYDSSGEFFYNDRVEYPSAPGSDYVMHVESNSSDGNRSHGTYTEMFSTAPAIQGFIDDFNASSGCSSNTDVQDCEAGANISYGYDITNSEAQSVNLTVYGFDSSGRVELMNESLEEGSTGYFTGYSVVPDLNTSRYSDEMEFVFNATNQDRFHMDRRNVTYEYFLIDDRSDPATYQGTDHEIQLLMGKPYSLDPYNKTRFEEINATVLDSDDENYENLSYGDFEYDSSLGLITSTVYIESDAPKGSYSLDVNATNIYGAERQESFAFTVRSTDATFDMQDEVEFPVNRLEEKTFYADIENLVDSSNSLDADTSNLPENVELANDSVTLEASETDVIAFDVNLTSLDDDTGNLTLTDSDTAYNETLEITIDAADCQIESGDLCSETGEVNPSASTTDEIEESIELRNIGPSNESVEFNISVEGEVGQYVEVDGDRENLTIEDEMDIDLIYSSDQSGEFSGEVVFETYESDLEVPTTFDVDLGDSEDTGGGSGSDEDTSNLEASDVTITPTTFSLGEVREFSSPSRNIQIRNSGEETLNGIEVTSEDFDISVSNIDSVEAGGSATLVVDFQEVSGNGELDVEAGPAQETISVSATVQSSTGSEDEQDSGDSGGDQSDPEEQDSTEEGSGLPVVPIAAGVVVFLLIIFVFFTSYVPEEGDPLYDVLGEGQ